MCIRLPALQTGKDRSKVGEYTEEEAGGWRSQLRSTRDRQLCRQLSDALRHVQRRQHLLKDGAFHVGASQVGFLEIAAGQVAVLQQRQNSQTQELKWFLENC